MLIDNELQRCFLVQQAKLKSSLPSQVCCSLNDIFFSFLFLGLAKFLDCWFVGLLVLINIMTKFFLLLLGVQ